MSPHSNISKRRYYNDRQYYSKDFNLLEVFSPKTSSYLVHREPKWNDPRAVDRTKDQRIDAVVVLYLGEPIIDIIDQMLKLIKQQFRI